MARGKPATRTTMTMVKRLVGRFSGSVRLPTSSVIKNAAEA